MKLLLLLLVMSVSACVMENSDRRLNNSDALREISAMMEKSATAWNDGKLDVFVSDYLAGTGTTFIGRSGIVRGPEAIKAVYAPRFAPGGVRDSLHFENIEVDVLAPGVVNTIAWYVLTRKDSVVARGPTSLVMRRTPDGWKIVHDHSS
jgi:ketosteroid isomerase-like protein